jgi:release factor glutamine methyltransferase
MKTIQSTIAEMQERFRAAGLETPELDARLLVQGVTGFSHEELLLNFNKLLTDTESKKLTEMAERRIGREPVSRILGIRVFWRSEFKVSSETLDPRADSETLIESVLKYADKEAPLTILDLGTGTGCLLLSLLQELPQAKGVGVDISEGAVQTARQNAEDLQLSSRAAFIAADWAEIAINNPFDIVISNPPYIADSEIPNLEPEVSRHDPHRALAGGVDGLDCYRSITRLLPRLLTPQGKVFLEIGYNQAGAVKGILAGQGYRVLQTVPDLAGHDRCIVAQ